MHARSVLRTVAVLGVFNAAALSSEAAMSTLISDYSAFSGAVPTIDGVINPGEFFNDPFPMSSANGAGGVLGPTAKILFNMQDPFSPSSVFSFGFQPGAAANGTLIVLLHTTQSGRTRGSGPGVVAINDQTDAARRALSSLQGAYPTGSSFPSRPSFVATMAITVNADGVGLFAFPDNQSSTFTQLGSYTGVRNPVTGVAEATFPNALIGQLFDFNFAAVYAADQFLYNEAVPAQPYSSGANPGAQTNGFADLQDFIHVGLFVPAPTSLPFLMCAGGLMMGRRRRA